MRARGFCFSSIEILRGCAAAICASEITAQHERRGWILPRLIAWVTAIRTNSGQTDARKFARVDLGTGGSEVSSAFQLPRRLPVGTKYVVEICGEFVRRFVELPNGARIPLRNRKARLSISSKRRLNGAGLQGPRWPRQPTRPNHRRK